MKISSLIAPVAAAVMVAISGPAAAQTTAERMALPIPPKPYEGKLEPTAKASTMQLPGKVSAPEGAPNILLVMTDDVGFASVSTFGGPAPTPNLDELARNGLRYNQFHTTAICSPTRAALLTGRNHHAVGLGTLSDIPTPYPGYTGRITPAAATVARILRDNGYSTAMFGKDHNIPQEERSIAGPFDQWPTGRGFDYFYGFIAGDSDQFTPALYENISPVDDADRPANYLLDEELADKAINWIYNQKGAAPDKPFFIYYANGSAHAPHQVPQEWIARFHGKFDQGWDVLREQILARQIKMGVVPKGTKLAARPEQVPAWDSLSDKQRKVYARFMEVYAAQLAFQDEQFGRIMDELERMGLADNTLVVYVEGDNGSSAEGGEWGSINEMADLSTGTHGLPLDYLAEHLDELGGPNTYQGYQSGWSLATDTPFPWFKQIASHLGGTRNGLVVSWPGHMQDTGEVRSQYHHVIDIMPTLLDAAGVPAPKYVDGIEQMPVHGKSMLYSFADADAPSVRDTQYYEIMGQRAIYHDGWMANTTPINMPWNMPVTRGGDTTAYGWELYNLSEDFSQSHNLAAKNPEKLAEMQALFDQEARKYNVYPIQDEGGMQRGMVMMMATKKRPRMEYTYWGPDVQVQFGVAPMIFHMPFSIEADVRIPEAGAEGVVFAAGSKFGGWSFYLENGKPTAYSSVSGLPLEGAQSKVSAKSALKPGAHKLRYDFQITGDDGLMSISVDGEKVAEGKIVQRPKMLAGNGETMDTGRDSNVPVSPDYHNEGVFTGAIDKVTVNLQMPAMAGKKPAQQH
ncbi:sulfatase-like hydrolase/transferase [Haliea sp. E17]|uniref:sulfatase-like hydrolase/transferase n=1 Tax=Haliea sp. E17 TaxID=3401576 RepID=UPI003AAB3B5B